MKELIRIYIITSLFIILSIGIISSGCSNRTHSSTLPWVEGNGYFYTRDLIKAQAEIPFDIVLPTYPEKMGTIYPEIQGPLKENQDNGKVEIEINYIIALNKEKKGIIWITEYNYVVLPPTPETNPSLEYIEIDGLNVIRSIDTSRPIRYYFNQNGIYFIVRFLQYDPHEKEAIKIIESMIE